jgi:hypothetical protein
MFLKTIITSYKFENSSSNKIGFYDIKPKNIDKMVFLISLIRSAFVYLIKNKLLMMARYMD